MKIKSVIPREQVNQDMDEIIQHYLSENAGESALNFIDALEEAYKCISHHPSIGSLRYAHELNLPGLRFWLLKRYPYLVFYVEQNDHIDVWRVLHNKRDIPAWLNEAVSGNEYQ